MVEVGIGPQDIRLDKTDKSLVFEVKHKDGRPLTEKEYRLLRDPEGVAEISTDPRMRRRFDDRLSRPYKLCSEGDSWINILWPLSAAAGYNETFVDIIERDSRFYINNIGWPGDEFSDIVAKKQYKAPIQSGIFDFFVLSGGGNDFLGGGRLSKFITPFDGHSDDPEAYIRTDRLRSIFEDVEDGYHKIIRDVQTWSPKTHIFLHGYDHAIPRPDGPWMGRPFSALGFDVASALPRKIIKYLVDEFYKLLRGIAARHAKVHLIDARGCLKGHWHDELHPDRIAAEKVAVKFIAKMEAIKPLAVS